MKSVDTMKSLKGLFAVLATAAVAFTSLNALSPVKAAGLCENCGSIQNSYAPECLAGSVPNNPCGTDPLKPRYNAQIVVQYKLCKDNKKLIVNCYDQFFNTCCG